MFGFLNQGFDECVQMTCSLTIWKADINTDIYIALNGVALLFATYKYQLRHHSFIGNDNVGI